MKARQLVDTYLTPPICRGLRISDFNSNFFGIRESVSRAIKRYTSCTSIEQTLFKQIVTGDKVLDLVHLSFLEKLLYILHHRVL